MRKPTKPFIDRYDAGRQLAEVLEDYANRPGLIVMGVTRGGVATGFEIAQALHAPMDVVLVRKVELSEHPEETVVGVVASGDIYILREDLLADQEANDISAGETFEAGNQMLMQHNALFKRRRNLPDLSGNTVIIADDSMITGATMEAAIAAVQQMGCNHIVIAVPVAPADVLEEVAAEVEEAICLYCLTTRDTCLADWYEDYGEITEIEESELLETRPGLP